MGQAVDWPWVLLSLALGWVWGSFLSQVVDRTPFRRPRPDGRRRRLTLLHPERSLCLSCGRPIAWYDNVPIVSYLVLRGRCRACGAAIGVRTLALEVLTPLGFAGLAAGLLRFGGGRGMLMRVALAQALLSWLLVAVPLLLERRRLGLPFLALGLAGLAALLAHLRWS